MLCKESDFISIHARQTPDNFHIFDEAQFNMMKRTAYFINTARASMVNYDALVRALKERKIAGAATDVYPKMPLDADDPIRKLDNITLSAHLAGSTRDAVINSWKYVSDFGVLNPEVLEMKIYKDWKNKVKDQIKMIE